MSATPRWIFVLLAAAFAARLAFGLAGELWGPDELQIFLIGLQYYTTGQWPLYGPDVVYTQTQVPGGLQGLLIGGPMHLVAIPEAAYVLLNLLSFAALALLAWYIGKRLPSVPRWFLWPWIFFSPWTLDLSTHITNPSYVLFGAVLFFISACELVPALRIGALPAGAEYFGLGFGVLWVYQLHLSASLLGPIAVLVVLLAARDDWRRVARGVPFLVAGAALAGATLLPTLASAGVGGVVGATRANMAFEPASLLRLPDLAAKFFSFGSFELPRFVGASTDERLAFLEHYWWAAPFAAFAALCGIAQTVVLVVGLIWPGNDQRGWRAVKSATIVLLVMLCLAFAFSIKEPASHAFYVMLPVVEIYAFYWWDRLLRNRRIRALAVALLVAGAVTHVALAIRNFRERSLYVNRPLVMRAIDEKDYRIVGERRPDAWRRGETPK